jgi:hypothetical protein
MSRVGLLRTPGDGGNPARRRPVCDSTPRLRAVECLQDGHRISVVPTGSGVSRDRRGRILGKCPSGHRPTSGDSVVRGRRRAGSSVSPIGAHRRRRTAITRRCHATESTPQRTACTQWARVSFVFNSRLHTIRSKDVKTGCSSGSSFRYSPLASEIGSRIVHLATTRVVLVVGTGSSID